MTDRPTVVCLCGSTRFWREFQAASLRETLAGKIVLSIGAASGTDDEHFGNLSREEYDRVKTMLDELHLRKIDLADEVLILNVGGYIGDSTRRELGYAIQHGKAIRFLEPRSELPKQRFALHRTFSHRDSEFVMTADHLSVLVRAWEHLPFRQEGDYVILNTERDVIVWATSRDALPLDRP